MKYALRPLWLMILSISILSKSFAWHDETRDDFDFIVNKIRCDYPGYSAKIHPKIFQVEQQIRVKLQNHPDSCYYYYDEYVNCFEDHHLRISRNTFPSVSTTSASLVRYTPVHDTLLSDTKVASKSLTGVWSGFMGDFVITKDTIISNKFYGISLSIRGLRKYQLLYEFLAENDSVFITTQYLSPATPTTASLHVNGRVLEIHNMDRHFVRKTQDAVLDQAFCLTYIPKYRNSSNNYWMSTPLDDSTFYLRIPSFDDSKTSIDNIVRKYWHEITGRPNLIIDLRGNDGGQSDAYEALLPLFYTHPYTIKGVEWYASCGNIEHIEQDIETGNLRDGEAGIRWASTLVKAMKQNVGGFVTHPNDIGSEHVTLDTVYAYPTKIGVIIDELNASAAEQFLLVVKNSTKTILFGNQPTSGVLDYSNITPNTSPSGHFELWCPMTRSCRLPDHPIDNIGIAPDILIPFPATRNLFDRYDDWVYFVLNYLNELN